MIGRRPSGRICFVVTGLCRGGAEAQLFHVASGLHARGFDVHVVAILSSDYFGAQLEGHGVPVTYLDASRTTSALRILARFLRCMRDLRPIALVGFNYPGVMLARTAGALARIPVVVSSIHTVNHGTWLRRLALAWTDSLATATTAVSHPVAQSLIELGVASTRVQVIPNGIDIHAVGPHLRTERAALRRSLGIGENEFFWFAAGRLDTSKDYPNLLAAMALLAKASTPVKLAIAGEGPLLKPLRERVAALGLDSIVSFLGLRGDVPSCMAAADATVLASAWEGLPLVVIESLAVGTPIVCTDVGGVREIVQDGGNGLVVAPRDPRALAQAMQNLMSCSEEQRRLMGEDGRRHVEGHFALEPVLSRWSQLLETLIAGTDDAESGSVTGHPGKPEGPSHRATRNTLNMRRSGVQTMEASAAPVALGAAARPEGGRGRSTEPLYEKVLWRLTLFYPGGGKGALRQNTRTTPVSSSPFMYPALFKRALDVVGAVLALIVAAPALLLIGVTLRIRLGSPVLFRQKRPGLYGRPFRIVKFRTMSDQRDTTGRLLQDGARLSAFGAFLRSTSLDELPELWNVLTGEMSLVGPRPLLMEYLERYTPEQSRRHAVRPGITGLAQVRGRNALTWDEKFALDLEYIKRRSLLLDIRILVSTIWQVITRQGVSQPGHATAEEFVGSAVR